MAAVAILDFQANILAIFDLLITPMLHTKFQVKWPQKKRNIDFQDGGHGGHLWFWIGTILATFIYM